MKHAWFLPDPLDGVAQLMPPVRDIEAAQVTQFDPLELCPQALARIEFRGIGWEALQVEAFRRAMGQEFLDDLTAMDGGAIPNNHEATRDLTQQMLQKGHHVGRVHRVVLRMEGEFALGRDGTDRRQMVVGVPFPQNRGLADGGIGAHDTGEWIKPRFVYEEDRLLLSLRPLLMAGQVSSRHCAMAASLRC